FTTKDGVILSQTDGTNTMYFQYDSSGNPAGFLYNGAQYFYLTNQMGDVIGITDNTGALIATYTYGAWGDVLSVTPATAGNTTQLAIANTNPLRYRGYYQDQETGYYYLQSRYYDSYVSRFINADNIIISRIIKSETAGTNLFAYCYNSSPSYEDSTGQFTLKIYLAMAIVSAVIAALSQIITNIVKRHYRGRKIFRNVTGYATGMAVNNVILMALIKRPALRKYSNLLAAFSGALVQSFIDCVERRIITGKKTLKGLTFAIIKNTAYGYVGNFLGARFKKTNPGWFQPKTLRSFFSKSYGQKLLQQSGISAAISLALSLLPSKQGGKLATIQRYLR
ncbi:MAG: RHS repeat-associated core domain-containing protein, partial [Aeriscardovia sp.]|nr:RHS repeat-associated core domain-containing protein [Aeriscardovia sp.]